MRKTKGEEHVLVQKLEMCIILMHVRDLPKDANLAGDKESDGDGRVDVSTADVCDHPDNRPHAEAETQRNLDDVAINARSAADENE